MVECAVENFMHKDYRLIYVHLLSGYFVKTSLQSSEQNVIAFILIID